VLAPVRGSQSASHRGSHSNRAVEYCEGIYDDSRESRSRIRMLRDPPH
jgi:hypothetical protein